MPKFETVDEYLDALPDDQRVGIEQIAARVLTVAPAATSVIRYDMPTWQLDGKSLVHAAAWKQHVSLYPVPPSGDADLDRDLAPYAGAKGHAQDSVRRGRLRPGRARGAAARGDVLMASRWSRMLTDAIDPVVSGTDFQPGQAAGERMGEPLGSGGSAIWCGGYAALQLSHPGLPQAWTQATHHDYGCIDLTVEVERGRLVEASLESLDLAETFEKLGRPDDAAAAAELIGQPGEVAIPALAVLVARLLEATAAH